MGTFNPEGDRRQCKASTMKVNFVQFNFNSDSQNSGPNSSNSSPELRGKRRRLLRDESKNVQNVVWCGKNGSVVEKRSGLFFP